MYIYIYKYIDINQNNNKLMISNKHDHKQLSIMYKSVYQDTQRPTTMLKLMSVTIKTMGVLYVIAFMVVDIPFSDLSECFRLATYNP